MSEGNTNSVACDCELVGAERLRREFQHLRSEWCWLLLFGILLVISGTVAIVLPAVTSIASMLILGIALTVAGVATIIESFWMGKWSGALVQLLAGVLYIVAGFVIFDTPVASAITMTWLVAAFFIIVGGYRVLAAMVVRFPHWGWALLNGIVTFLLGVVIYRHFRESSIWILGLLIGLELLFNGWTWIMLALAVRSIPEKTA